MMRDTKRQPQEQQLLPRPVHDGRYYGSKEQLEATADQLGLDTPFICLVDGIQARKRPGATHVLVLPRWHPFSPDHKGGQER